MMPDEEELAAAAVIGKVVDALSEGTGVFLEKQYDGNLRITKCGAQSFVELGKNENLFHCVGMEMRAGVSYFCNYLENHFFPPETPENDEMQYRLLKWNKILWHVVSVPLNKKQFCLNAAKEARLKLQDAIPFVVGPVVASTRCLEGKMAEMRKDGHLKVFPLDGPTVFTLENDHGQKDGFVNGIFGDNEKENEAIDRLMEQVKHRHERN